MAQFALDKKSIFPGTQTDKCGNHTEFIVRCGGGTSSFSNLDENGNANPEPALKVCGGVEFDGELKQCGNLNMTCIPTCETTPQTFSVYNSNPWAHLWVSSKPNALTQWNNISADKKRDGILTTKQWGGGYGIGLTDDKFSNVFYLGVWSMNAKTSYYSNLFLNGAEDENAKSHSTYDYNGGFAPMLIGHGLGAYGGRLIVHSYGYLEVPPISELPKIATGIQNEDTFNKMNTGKSFIDNVFYFSVVNPTVYGIYKIELSATILPILINNDTASPDEAKPVGPDAYDEGAVNKPTTTIFTVLKKPYGSTSTQPAPLWEQFDFDKVQFNKEHSTQWKGTYGNFDGGTAYTAKMKENQYKQTYQSGAQTHNMTFYVKVDENVDITIGLKPAYSQRSLAVDNNAVNPRLSYYIYDWSLRAERVAVSEVNSLGPIPGVLPP